LNVSIRTVQRDIEYLREQGGPIRWNAARHGYEYTDLKYIPPLEVKITEGDLLAVLSGERVLEEYRGTPYEGLLQRIFMKLGQALPDPISLKMKDLVASLSQQLPPPAPSGRRGKGRPAARRRGVPRAAPAEMPPGPTTLRLRFVPELAAKIGSMEWPAGVELQNRMDGGLDLIITTAEPDDILLWTLQWGRRVEIVSPAWGRRHLAQLLKGIRARLQGGAEES
jgi:predicted DNA-binding transcriptional regulator YafY